MSEREPYLTFGAAWEIQRTVGPSLDHDPKCSSVPGHHPFSGPALLCDCGAVEREWERRQGKTDLIPTPRTDAARSIQTLPQAMGYVPAEKMEEIERELAETRAQRDRLVKAGKALVDRWETPFWKDVPATAKFIRSLADAIAAVKAEPAAPIIPQPEKGTRF